MRFALKCDRDHSFESWFQSNDAFDKLVARGLVECPVCGSTHVSKELMAPKVRTSRKKALPIPAEKPAAPPAHMASPDPEVAEAIQKLKKHVETNSDYVGDSFAKEARAMHEGDKPHRAIHGQANAEEARKLIEDDVPVLPLPFIPRQKTN
ncbi:MAG: DUF1178 family protein [Pseudomonadota bacterium]